MPGQSLVTVDFHGASLIAIRGATPAETLVAMKPVVDGMGLSWEGQRLKLERHPVLSTCTIVKMVQMPGEDQAREITFLSLNRLNFWLATIHPDRLRDVRTPESVIAYQTECADVLFNHFFAGRLAERDLQERSDQARPHGAGTGVAQGARARADRQLGRGAGAEGQASLSGLGGTAGALPAAGGQRMMLRIAQCLATAVVWINDALVCLGIIVAVALALMGSVAAVCLAVTLVVIALMAVRP